MKRFQLIFALAALLAAPCVTACGGTWSDEDLRFYASLPDRAALESKLPQDRDSRAGSGQQALVGEAASLYLDTRQQSRNFNEGLLGILDDLEAATARAPSSRAPGLRVWGPFAHRRSKQHEVRLLVRWVEPALDDDPSNDDQPDHFEHALQMRRLGEDDLAWVAVIAGAFVPGASGSGRPGPRLGKGGLVLDVEGLRALGLSPPATLDAVARIEMVYDTSAWPVGVGVAMIPVDPATGALRYGYLEGEAGGGLLRFVVRRDLVGGPALEALVVASAWLPGGPGRANVRLRGGDLAAPVGMEQCWDLQGILTFERDWQGREEGRRLACPAIVPPEPTEP